METILKVAARQIIDEINQQNLHVDESINTYLDNIKENLNCVSSLAAECSAEM
ncbi:hypothetical protein [Methylophaga sp. UBA2689]|uniref:hypothetical protein n=1 Tax=Methylophaga sp. UBA2689 TaxID=1946878 RepID=UPI0025E13E8B|nr:hypothetical protein [Methylophaga sp. UBA2689]|tara:strand:+ start:3262 stop:3420 length:159 start_codon:yes stop_codon:yes gene_type:complete